MSVSPATWTPSSSQAFTVTLNVTGTVIGYVGFWENNGVRAWTLSSTGSHNGTLAGNVLTCTTGVTYTSSLFTSWGNGIKNNVCEDDQGSSYFEIGFSGNGAGISGPGTIVISLPAGFLTAPATTGSTIFQAYAFQSGTPTRTSFTVTVVQSAPPVNTVSAPDPAPITQQFGKPTTGACNAAQPDGLNWAGVASGGWTETWGQWMNDDKGGAACTRTLTYSNALQAWTVG